MYNTFLKPFLKRQEVRIDEAIQNGKHRATEMKDNALGSVKGFVTGTIKDSIKDGINGALTPMPIASVN